MIAPEVGDRVQLRRTGELGTVIGPERRPELNEDRHVYVRWDQSGWVQFVRLRGWEADVVGKES